MNFKIILFSSLILCLTPNLSCTESIEKETFSFPDIVDTLTQDKVIVVEEEIVEPIQDTIQVVDSLFEDGKSDPSLQNYVDYLKVEWGDVASPFQAKYVGNVFGDYFHLMFEDTLGNMYDFGDGFNDFGKYDLILNDEQLTDNPKYLNQTFLIYWDWRKSTFPCCDGNMEVKRTEIPSILKLALLLD